MTRDEYEQRLADNREKAEHEYKRLARTKYYARRRSIMDTHRQLKAEQLAYWQATGRGPGKTTRSPAAAPSPASSEAPASAG